MNGTANPSWSAPEQFDPMAGVAEHDFTSLLDLDIDLDFPSFDQNAAAQSQEGDRQLKELADSLDMQHLPPSGEISAFQDSMNSGQPHRQRTMAPPTTSQDMGPSYMAYNMPQFNQVSQAHPQFTAAPSHVFSNYRGVPPTPNSVEMHGDPTRFLQLDTQTQAMMDSQQHFSMRKDDSSFPQLVSPAVTPSDARFHYQSEFGMPVSYITPLTSPALDGQMHPNHHLNQAASQGSGSSAAPSPVDFDTNMLGDPASAQPDASHKSKARKTAPSRSTGPSAKVRQSPITKPQRRRTRLQPKEVNEIIESVQTSGDHSRPQSTSGVPSREPSTDKSISPEPLTESLMGPPPLPGSVSQSPSLMAHMGHGSGPLNAGNQGVPATPASLMRLQKSPDAMSNMSPSFQGSGHLQQRHGLGPPMLDDLQLPEAADTSQPSIPQNEPTISDDTPTPRISARKTPKLGPLSSPSAALALSGKQSPALGPLASPSTINSPVIGKKLDARGARGKKRGSIASSTLVSPMLRPKISPSIKPLLPDGGLSDEKHALLLATKSNYQNILEGTHVPGVTYPEALTTNLTSKRTSHKIAEQGRRNRINTALQEMQSLLPSPTVAPKTPKLATPADGHHSDSRSPGAEGSDGAGANKAAAQGSSKAATVEQAIEFIKQLKREAGERERVIETKDKEVEELRKRLAQMEKRLADTGRRSSICSDASMADAKQEQELDSGGSERREMEVDVVKE